jgi:hypothetical protein
MPGTTASCKRDDEKKGNGLTLDNIIIIIIVIIVIIIVVKALTNPTGIPSVGSGKVLDAAGNPISPFIGESFTAANEYSSIFDLGATPVA